MDAFARWIREVDCEVAYATGGMMHDDLTYSWDRAFERGSPPSEAARHACVVLGVAAL